MIISIIAILSVLFILGFARQLKIDNPVNSWLWCFKWSLAIAISMLAVILWVYHITTRLL